MLRTTFAPLFAGTIGVPGHWTGKLLAMLEDPMAVTSIGGIESTAKVGGHPIHPMLVPFPIALLTATLVCDIVFLSTGNPFWATAAIWALGAGVATGALAAVAGIADFLGNARIRALRDAWHHFAGNAAVLVLSFA